VEGEEETEAVEEEGGTTAVLSPYRVPENLLAGVLPPPDIDYEVVKINQMGRHQSRTLRLTSTALFNMRGTGKNDKIVSKYKPLNEIDAVYLEDRNTLRIKYINEHDVIYESPIADKIVNDIRVSSYL
jgi:hypothetical protein